MILFSEKGVRSFFLNAPTALASDWSKLAMAFWLTQKFCKCDGDPKPGCCPSGWQTVYVGSRFCTSAESRYHPIEGEACASAWALEKCRYFVLGHPQLLLAVDHKPLLAIFDVSYDLSQIHNPRLLNFKTKTLLFRFTPIHIPGKNNVVPDVMSRRADSPIQGHPRHDPLPMNNVLPQYSSHLSAPSWVTPPSLSAILAPLAQEPTDIETIESRNLETSILELTQKKISTLMPHTPATIAMFGVTNVEVLTWTRLTLHCQKSEQYKSLHHMVSSGCSDNSDDWELEIKPYFRHRHALSTIGPVVLLHDRPVILTALQSEVLEHLHAAHNGVTVMFERASSSVYWPGYKEDITHFQAKCLTCRTIAPSNPALPPEPLQFP